MDVTWGEDQTEQNYIHLSTHAELIYSSNPSPYLFAQHSLGSPVYLQVHSPRGNKM